MTVTQISANRHSAILPMSSSCLEDRFEVIKDIGDGSFGSVALARVRTAGAHIAKRGTMVAIKTMKKTFDSFTPCLELREVIFLRSLPTHAHLVPALDIFLDPTTKRLHICMECMDGNLYQLMKAREHRILDGASVKSILFQILSGLDHIHAHRFFHRDIKPENILISTSALYDSVSTFRRYSALMTPPSTPPAYTVKIADFGLAREMQSKVPFTTYVSTRWYRAPEVLLRAGEYSAPVDMWAVGAMAVEIATLKPLFPGQNEVDQVWRVCEIMGSPGNWQNKLGHKVGGGDWREGTKLAQKLGFSFPKMAPHAMETILPLPQWPLALANFVTWCLMWDPKNRPTSAQAMNHAYFTHAVDPLRPRPSATRLLGRKHSSHDARSPKEAPENIPSTRSSWFRKSLIARESAPAVPQQAAVAVEPSRSPPLHVSISAVVESPKARPHVGKRATWTNGATVGAPMPILPSIRPVSPLSNAVTAQAPTGGEMPERSSKKIGRQLSVASHGNHYADVHRADSDKKSHSQSALASPTSGTKEGFFSHLRKRARRLSGRNQIPNTPKYEDVESIASTPWARSNRSSMTVDTHLASEAAKGSSTDLDRALQSVRYGLDPPAQGLPTPTGSLRKHHSLQQVHLSRAHDDLSASTSTPAAVISATSQPISSRTRRALHFSMHPAHRYETPDEEDELLDEALHGVQRAVRGMDRTRHVPAPIATNLTTGLSASVSATNLSSTATHISDVRPILGTKDANRAQQTPAAIRYAQPLHNPYPTPSPTAKRNGALFSDGLMHGPVTPVSAVAIEARGMPRGKADRDGDHHIAAWPTPPSENSDWAAAATASILSEHPLYR